MGKFQNFKTKKLFYIIMTVLLLFFVALIGIYSLAISYSNEDSLPWVKVYGFVGWISLIWSIFTWKRIRNEVICIYNIFLIILYLFSFGHSLMFVLGFVTEPDWLLSQFTVHQLMEAQVFTLLCLISFHVGALIICKKSSFIVQSENMFHNNSIERNQTMLKSIKYLAMVLLLISFPSFIYSTVNTTVTVIHGGYMALYGYDNIGANQSVGLLNRIVSFTSLFFIPALICLLIVYRTSPNKRRLILTAMIISTINSLYIGGRNNAVTLILVIICIYHYLIKPINIKSALKLGIFGYIFVSFLTIVARLRTETDKVVSDYIIAFIDAFSKENLFVMTIIELGGSMFPLGKVMQIFPSSIDYWGGKSYFYALFSLVPNLGFWDVHPATKYADGANWLMHFLNMSYGPGFSLFADAFRNFGWMGFLVFVGFGMLFGRIYSSIDRNLIVSRPDILCLVMIFAHATMMSARGDNLYIIRPFFYIVIPIYILLSLINNHLLIKQIKQTKSDV